MTTDMPDQNAVIEAVSDAAAVWQDPEHAPRTEAVEKTLAASNTFTEEAVAFAVNQQMSLLQPAALAAWVGGRQAATPRRVGVLNAGNVPLVDLQDFLAVALTGHRYRGTVSSRSPYLLPAFVDEVRARVPRLDATFLPADALFEAAEAVIATGSDETRQWAQEQCEAHGIPASRRLLRGHRYAVAVIDGRESEDELEELAEDTLLHEGRGCRNVALIWAPRGLSPDALLDAFAAFRGVFPAHAGTPGTLKMQQAFLEATGQPHAFGENLEFLLSRGEPEVQPPGHVRWVEYDDLADVDAWLTERAEELQLVVARPGLVDRLWADVSIVPPGQAQRPALDWCPDGVDTVAFLAGL